MKKPINITLLALFVLLVVYLFIQLAGTDSKKPDFLPGQAEQDLNTSIDLEREQKEESMDLGLVSEQSEEFDLDSSLLTSLYAANYELIDLEHGTETVVTVSENTRSIISNALPNHDTGTFPNSGNPNRITEQEKVWEFPVNPIWTGKAVSVREPGVSINGVKFEPGTAEEVHCASGESYRIEAIQNMTNLGLDFNNAHVQPNGEYHYHGVSELMVDTFDQDEDLVHVGFAVDGYFIYYSKSGAYKPSYRLSSKKRKGVSCTYSARETINVDINETSPDGTYVSDWSYDEGYGDLDECNGVMINGNYGYVITHEYPYIGRCLNGVFTEPERSPSGHGDSMRPQHGQGAGIPPRR